MKSRRFCIHAILKTGKNTRSSVGNESSKTKGPTSACKYFFCIFCIMRIPFSFFLYIIFLVPSPLFAFLIPPSFIFDSLPVEHVPWVWSREQTEALRKIWRIQTQARLLLATAFITGSFKFSIPSKISRGQRKQSKFQTSESCISLEVTEETARIGIIT